MHPKNFTIFLSLLVLLLSCDNNPPAKKDIISAVEDYYRQHDTTAVYNVQNVSIINIGSQAMDSIRWQVITAASVKATSGNTEEEFIDTLELNFYRDNNGWQSVTVPQ